MHDRSRLILPAAVVLAAVLALVARTPSQTAPAQPEHVDVAMAQRTFTWGPGVTASDRALVLGAIGAARPEARRLIDLVDGSVTFSAAATPAGTLGRTTGVRGDFAVTVDLAKTLHELGVRGVDRVVLHELGHVVDFTLVPEDLDRRLDAEIPAGYACDPGEPTGACAAREERFAETFAKWATGDLGLDLWVGYKVMAPTIPIETWGEPLTHLG